jgi:hypothetical protein
MTVLKKTTVALAKTLKEEIKFYTSSSPQQRV